MLKKIPFTIITFNIIFSQLFFSEYAEGSSIYNAGQETVDLAGYAYPSAANDITVPGEYEYWNNFDDGASIAPGDVFVICHGSADAVIQAECDHTHTYLSNGNDGYCIVFGDESSYSILDCVGDWNNNPGTGWSVAGVSNATVDHTLVRKIGVTQGNGGDWTTSAGTTEEDSEWVVLSNEDWTYLGSHPHEDFSGGGTTGGDGGTDSEDCSNGIDDDGDSFIDCDDFDCNGDTACPGGEICDDGIDNDNDTFIDCDDFGCSGDPACGSGTGSCAEYGCVDYTPTNACQCNDLCVEYNNCCDDYEELCAGTDGGTTGGGDGGSEPVDADNIFFSEYAEGSSYNKYLEIYNASEQDVDLSLYALSNCGNGCNDGVSWDYYNEVTFSVTLSPAEIYVVCDSRADATILAECDQFHQFLSNGDDVYGLTQVATGGILDIIGVLGDDPGNGWSVAGETDATKDHTLVRKPNVLTGNFGDWSTSAGTNEQNSEWIVYDQNTWDGLGNHFISDGGPVPGCTDEEAYNYNSYATEDDGSCEYPTQATINQIQGESDVSPYADTPVITSGVITGVSYNGFYMQDGDGMWNGIWVYAENVEGFESLLSGDLVEVEGLVIEYNELTEIESTAVSVQSSGNSLPNPSEINTGDMSEAYEGVLVKFTNASCFALPDDYGEWQVNDGSGLAFIDDKVLSYTPDLNQAYDIIGVGDFSYGTYKVQATDVSIAYQEGYPISIAGDNQSVEFGDTVTLDGSASYTDDGIILGFLWSQIGGVDVDLGDYENDVVTFTAPDQYTNLTFALEVVNSLGNSSVDYVSVTVGQIGIYSIQYTDDIGSADGDCYPTLYENEEVTVNGIVTLVHWNTDKPDFFIQDPNFTEWAGIFVYVDSGMDVLTVGDEVSLNASVKEAYSVTELTNISSYSILSSGNSVNSTSISSGQLGVGCNASGEVYEGMLVTLSNLTINSIDEYDNIYVDDGSGQTKINDYYFNFDNGFFPDLGVGDQIESVTGVVHYYFDEFAVYPRNLNDINASGGGETGGGTTDGLCADYGCGTYDSENSCQCDDGCSTYGNCCSDYEELCDGSTTGGGDTCEDSNLGSTTGGGDEGGDTCEGSNLDNLFFSEIAEGTSNNKYLEVYNAGDQSVDLCGYAFPNSTNGADVDGVYDYWNTFDSGAIVNAGDVYVICHGSADDLIQAECDQHHTYLSNGDDGFCLAYGDETDFSILDCIGTWSAEDPGDGWEVAGIEDATKEHTLVRKSSVSLGNQGDWDSSAGTNEEDSEWIVLDQNNWDNIGTHEFDGSTSSCILGDANNDGIVNVVDVVLMVSLILDSNSAYNECGDVNDDGILNVVDIVAVVSIILGS